MRFLTVRSFFSHFDCYFVRSLLINIFVEASFFLFFITVPLSLVDERSRKTLIGLGFLCPALYFPNLIALSTLISGSSNVENSSCTISYTRIEATLTPTNWMPVQYVH